MVLDESARRAGTGAGPLPGPAAADPGRRRGLVQLVGVAVAGGAGWVVDVTLLWLLHEVAGVRTPVAAAVGFSASALVNFLVNRAVFGARRGAARAQLVRYAVLFAANLAAVSAAVGPLAGVLRPALGGGGSSLVAAKVVLTVALLPVNLLAYRRWVFR